MRVVRTVAIALILVVVSGRPAAAQEGHEGEGAGAQAHEEGSHGAFRNEVALFFGNTRKSNHNAVTVGLDYARVLRNRWSLGLFADYASSESERDFILGAGLWFEVIEHAAILVGGGVEREEIDEEGEGHGAVASSEGAGGAKTVGLLRVGATYVFHFGPEGRWGIAPQAFLDVVEGHDAWVLGFAFGYLF